MALNVRIREASLDDNEGLIELIRLCPMQGHIQMYLDRYPNYFAMTRLQGERSFVYVAEDLQRNLIGSVVLLERLEWWNGGWRKVLHIGDMRTAPAWRGSRVAAEFIEIYRQKLLGGPYDLGFAEIMDGNLAPIKAQKLLGEQLAVNYEGPVNLYQLLPLKTYRVTDHYSYRRAEPKDLAAIARLLAATYAQSHGSPPFTVQYLEKMTHQHASFGISHIWLAENGEGRLLACLATWDQKNLRRTAEGRD
ncbi:MAG: hypothetical protein NTX25_16220 [Proteobacteria bacterium]|nr:hypothetical protein [Pseudomonadota bacterium]